MNKLRRCAFALVAFAALGTAGLAQARSNVYWSVGVNAAPGVALNVGSIPPMVAAPVYVAPAPVYYGPPVTYVQPAPVYYVPSRVIYGRPVYVRRHHHWR